MLLSALLACQVAAVLPPRTGARYASRALELFVDSAAEENRRAPEALSAYRALVESELAIALLDSAGREMPLQVEQFISRATWTRRSDYQIHVIGYRTPSLTMPVSLLQSSRWGVPHLYGDRFSFRFIELTGPRSREYATRDTVVPVHPFAADRERFYRFAGGDTVATLRTRNRAIPIVRLTVTPQFGPADDGAAFEGDLYLDAARRQIVRLRGRFVRFMPTSHARARVRTITATEMAAYVDITCEEVDGRFWLPATQRIEVHVGTGFIGRTRVAARFVSSARDYVVDPRNGDSVPFSNPQPAIVTFASTDSLGRYDGWGAALGAATARARAADFDDIAPEIWKPSGPRRLSVAPSRASRLVHFDRVEGWFTGSELAVAARGSGTVDALAVRAFGGWAWTERTVRGGAAVARRRGEWATSVHLERALENTNDFRLALPFLSSGFGNVLGTRDDNDYVDRVVATMSQTRFVNGGQGAILTLQVGVGRDRGAAAQLMHSVWADHIEFRANRPVATGSYGRIAADVDLFPGIAFSSVTPGVGGRLHFEVAAGDLTWQRVTATIEARRGRGPLTLSERVDAGIVLGRSPPPQQLFELGGDGFGPLPGYTYKQFAGDRAVLGRLFANYALPFERRPRRIAGLFTVPGLMPGIGAGVHAGWTALTSTGARAAAACLSSESLCGPALAHDSAALGATGRVLGSAGVGLTLFAGLVHAGVALPFDRGARWRWTFGVGVGP